VSLEFIFIPTSDDADAPREGLYQWVRAGCVPRAVRVWFGLPSDPLTGEPLDRSPRWQLAIDGAVIDGTETGPWAAGWADVWPLVADAPIGRAEYEYLVARWLHGERVDHREPFGRRGGRVDLMTAPLAF